MDLIAGLSPGRGQRLWIIIERALRRNKDAAFVDIPVAVLLVLIDDFSDIPVNLAVQGLRFLHRLRPCIHVRVDVIERCPLIDLSVF